jgi:hypothetical protein
MFQIDNATAASTKPASTPPGVAGYFTDGNPAIGEAATIVPAEWLNAIMMEVINVLVAANITPDKAQFNQLLTAISTVTRTLQATETLAGVARIATQALTNAGADDTTMVTPKKLRAGFTSSFGFNGFIAFPSWLGGLIIQWGNVTADANGVANTPWPVTFPTQISRCVTNYIVSGATPTNVASNVSSLINVQNIVAMAANMSTGAGIPIANIAFIAVGY